MKHFPWYLLAMFVVVIVVLPATVGRADIVIRDLGVDAAGNRVTGYVYQSSRGRSLSRRSRLGPRVSSGSWLCRGGLVNFGGAVNSAAIVVAPRSTFLVPFRVGFCRVAGQGLASQSFRAVNFGGRFSFKLGF